MQSIYRDGTSVRIVRSDGAELTADGGYEGGWTVSWEGLRDFNSLPITLSTSANVLTDGSTLVSKRVDECERTASIFYKGPRDPASVRDECLSFFNPKHSFAVHVNHMGRTRWCEGELADVKCEILADRFPCQATFTILCPDPYMRSEDGNDVPMTGSSPMFGFPYVSHFKAPLPDGAKKPVGSLASKMLYQSGENATYTVYNSGDVPCYYVIRMRALGEIETPTFTIRDRHIQVLDTFETDDVLTIDFTSAPPRVLKNDENVIGRCSRDSNFTDMQLDVGANDFGYTCGNVVNRPLMDVRVLFNKRYLGV